MKTLRSYVCGAWHEAQDGFKTLVNPSTEEEIARVSSRGVDFAAAVAYARESGSAALREMTFAERGALLKAMSKTLRTHRDELLDLSRQNNGTTVPDGCFDVDGASGTFHYYSGVGKGIGDRAVVPEGDGVQLAKDESFWVQHMLAPRVGAVAVAINAFNFPAWGFAEKAACALLAGTPVIVKPATATALVAARTVEVLIEAEILPEGALQLICGGTGDLLDHLGAQDVFAFTGSAATAEALRQRPNFLRTSTRVNIEADSLNPAVLGPGIEPGSPTFNLFIKDVAREMTQKAGQKCTAVRRVLVPSQSVDAVTEALKARLGKVVTGNPADESVRMGPLATADQLADAEAGVAELLKSARLVHGSGRRADGVGSPEGKGYFLEPTLLVAEDKRSEVVHTREVFAPVGTVVAYDDTAEAAELVGLGGGMLVTSVYSDDRDWLGDLVPRIGSSSGRIYLGSEESTGFGSGAALPQALHGGPGRAGGGEELGGMAGVALYLQRVAVQGSRAQVEGVTVGG